MRPKRFILLSLLVLFLFVSLYFLKQKVSRFFPGSASHEISISQPRRLRQPSSPVGQNRGKLKGKNHRKKGSSETNFSISSSQNSPPTTTQHSSPITSRAPSFHKFSSPRRIIKVGDKIAEIFRINEPLIQVIKFDQNSDLQNGALSLIIEELNPNLTSSQKGHLRHFDSSSFHLSRLDRNEKEKVMNRYMLTVFRNNSVYRVGNLFLRLGNRWEMDRNTILSHPQRYGHTLLFCYLSRMRHEKDAQSFYECCKERLGKRDNERKIRIGKKESDPFVSSHVNKTLLIHIRLGDTNSLVVEKNEFLEAFGNVVRFVVDKYRTIETLRVVTALHFGSNELIQKFRYKEDLEREGVKALYQVLSRLRSLRCGHPRSFHSSLNQNQNITEDEETPSFLPPFCKVEVQSSSDVDEDFLDLTTSPYALLLSRSSFGETISRIRGASETCRLNCYKVNKVLLPLPMTKRKRSTEKKPLPPQPKSFYPPRKGKKRVTSHK